MLLRLSHVRRGRESWLLWLVVLLLMELWLRRGHLLVLRVGWVGETLLQLRTIGTRLRHDTVVVVGPAASGAGLVGGAPHRRHVGGGGRGRRGL